MKNNFFNIIIPTRNRLETLRHSLATVLNQNYLNYKIIVSDNCSIDGTRDYIESLKSEKIDYFNTGKSLSMSSNYEFAISKIKEGFVILIGDDDGLLPSALSDINHIINKENALAISSSTAIYYWPGASPHENLLMIPRGGVNVERRKSNIFIKKVLEGNLDYSELPMIYTGGVVHSSLIAKAKNCEGRFYNSFTPDVYSGIAVASVADEYIRITNPFAISGLSKHSNGQSQLGSNKDASIAQTFFRENDIPFISALGDGRIKSLHLLTLEAYIQCGFLRLNDEVDMNRQFEIVVAKAPKNLRPEIKSYLKLHCDFHPKLLSISQSMIYVIAFKFLLKSNLRRVKRFIQWDVIFVEHKISNVNGASEFIDKLGCKFSMKISYKLDLIKKYLLNL
ncbi:MAG: glycosyltransferase family 2 protein [Rhodoferax sp.]|uniref:glycosyltransferase family 2 protein n=1 Tax=Rhodoferax sp. TaxID=50421 RepID=UPI00181A4CD6|nr:glycosyltransferase family A protein [Rhodoferax sp.]NMM20418.1 glycosyltransferase family 2 protein [Rhodoferax sp.]